MSEWDSPSGEDPSNTLISGFVMKQRKIIAKEVAQDIHAGNGDTPLMDKYRSFRETTENGIEEDGGSRPHRPHAVV